MRTVIIEMTGSLPPPRVARYGTLRLADKSALDRGLVLFFPAPDSFTGEDCGEFQVHGGRAVVEALLRTVVSRHGCRLAVAGEFTRRAFENGKMSLLDAEATADMIAADTEGQRRFAVINSGGAHAMLYADWRSRLIRARALIEAELDFSDEGDIPGSVSEQVWEDVAALEQDVRRHASGYGRAEILRDGFDVVLVGATNAGKSSLLNALAQREAAIVTDEPGTTRDLVEVALDIEGLKVRLTDTAGLRETEGKVERIGIERARERARLADLVLHLEDMSNPVGIGDLDWSGEVLRVGTKSDLAPAIPSTQGYDHVISCISGEGVSSLIAAIGYQAAAAAPVAGELIPWRVRHVELLGIAADHLQRALTSESHGLELRSEDLRLGAEALGRITGAIDVEDLLDAIFGQFCVGK